VRCVRSALQRRLRPVKWSHRTPWTGCMLSRVLSRRVIDRRSNALRTPRRRKSCDCAAAPCLRRVLSPYVITQNSRHVQDDLQNTRMMLDSPGCNRECSSLTRPADLGPCRFDETSRRWPHPPSHVCRSPRGRQELVRRRLGLVGATMLVALVCAPGTAIAAKFGDAVVIGPGVSPKVAVNQAGDARCGLAAGAGLPARLSRRCVPGMASGRLPGRSGP
jgi:hypothetical protein